MEQLLNKRYELEFLREWSENGGERERDEVMQATDIAKHHQKVVDAALLHVHYVCWQESDLKNITLAHGHFVVVQCVHEPELVWLVQSEGIIDIVLELYSCLVD